MQRRTQVSELQPDFLRGALTLHSPTFASEFGCNSKTWRIGIDVGPIVSRAVGTVVVDAKFYATSGPGFRVSAGVLLVPLATNPMRCADAGNALDARVPIGPSKPNEIWHRRNVRKVIE